MVTANAMVKEISKLSPVLTFTVPTEKKSIEPFLCSFSDASYNISSKNSYGLEYSQDSLYRTLVLYFSILSTEVPANNAE